MADSRHGSVREREEYRQDEHFIEVLRRFQLAAAGVMLVGLTISTLVCAGEFKMPWLVGAGGAVFLLGILCFFLSRPLARWWVGRK